jgi:hypothetical protein
MILKNISKYDIHDSYKKSLPEIYNILTFNTRSYEPYTMLYDGIIYEVTLQNLTSDVDIVYLFILSRGDSNIIININSNDS